MNLVKWLRRNNKKVMAVVVIVIMFGFIGGSYIRQLGIRRSGLYKTLAYYADNRKITNYDRAVALQELETLKLLRTDVLLRNIGGRVSRAQDLLAFLLGELLFSERAGSPQSVKFIKGLVRLSNYAISDEQIDQIYERPMGVGSEMYWLLLDKEAQMAGIRIANEHAGRQLAGAVSQFAAKVPGFEGLTYKRLIGSVMKQQRIAEKQILSRFARLLAVLEYASVVCASEGVTNAQVVHNTSWDMETMDVEFVRFDSSVFAKTQNEPSEKEMSEHFEKYKRFYAGEVSKENPYGFGYKLPERVQLEYIAVKLDDVAGTIAEPTDDEAEEYFDAHRGEFTELVPSDPNDPNSPTVKQPRKYDSQLEESILNQLMQSRIDSKANTILQQAKSRTEAGLEEAEAGKVSSEQLREMVGDYNEVAEQLSKEYKTRVYTGRTGLLSAAQMQTDEYLGRLYVEGYGHNPPDFQNRVALSRIVFAIDELGTSYIGPFDAPKRRMYENIGPVKDRLGEVMGLVRVIKAAKSAVPESLSKTYNKAALRLGQDPNQRGEDVYSVKEKVAEDLKKLAAMGATESKAKEFIRQVVMDGWEGAIDKFNELYGENDQNEAEPNAFILQRPTGLRRISGQQMHAWQVQNKGNPLGRQFVNEVKIRADFVDRLYALVPEDSNSLETVPYILKFEPRLSYYCIKKLSVNRLYREQYEQVKPQQVLKEDYAQSQDLAVIHFNPENILKRMNFRRAGKQEPADVNAPARPKDTS